MNMRYSDTNIRALLPTSIRREIIINFTGARPGRFLLEAAITWVLIVGSVATALIVDNVFVSALTVLFVATRQNILGLLIHEQTHKLGLKGKYGDWIANFIAGYPLIILSVENYAKVHLSHHRYYFTKKDPDFVRKNGVDWLFPFNGLHLLALFCKDLSGLTLLQNIKGKNVRIDDNAVTRPYPTPIALKVTYFAIAAGLLTYFQFWAAFLLYWILPLITVLQAVVRWGALCEHTYGIENAKVEDTSPIIILSWWERLLVPNLNFTLHPYHHYFPSVSFSNLPKVHQIFVREGLVAKETVFNGYFSYLKHLLRGGVEVRPEKPGAPHTEMRRAH